MKKISWQISMCYNHTLGSEKSTLIYTNLLHLSWPLKWNQIQHISYTLIVFLLRHTKGFKLKIKNNTSCIWCYKCSTHFTGENNTSKDYTKIPLITITQQAYKWHQIHIDIFCKIYCIYCFWIYRFNSPVASINCLLEHFIKVLSPFSKVQDQKRAVECGRKRARLWGHENITLGCICKTSALRLPLVKQSRLIELCVKRSSWTYPDPKSSFVDTTSFELLFILTLFMVPVGTNMEGSVL